MTALRDMDLGGLVYKAGSVDVNAGLNPGVVTSGIAHGLGVAPAALLVGGLGFLAGFPVMVGIEGAPDATSFAVRSRGSAAGGFTLCWAAFALAGTPGLRLEDRDQAQDGVFVYTQTVNDAENSPALHTVAHDLGATPRAAFVMLDALNSSSVVPLSGYPITGWGGVQSMDAADISFGYAYNATVDPGSYTPQKATLIAFR